jgi:Ca2+-binding EF-hand superfamily protein
MKAHVFAAAAFLGAATVAQPALASPTGEPQLRPRSAQMRFRAMDTNNDGVITRAEWRGNDRSFRNHDWNNDGILSGDEIRQGAVPPRENQNENGFYEWTRAGFRSVDANRDNRITRNEWNYDYELFLRADRNRDNVLTLAEFLGGESVDLDREDRFSDLDTDNNGVIERREWHGTREAFNWLDRNNDGRLSRSETVENDLPTGTSGRTVENNQVVHVSAQTRWTDTGITVRAGDTLRVRAEGTITMSNASDIADPAGARNGRRAPDAPLRDYPAGALIAKIGDSQPFLIGDRSSVQRMPMSGRLYLSVNDDYLGDNTGEFRVTLSVVR